METYLDLLLSMPLFQGIREKKDLAWVMKCVDGDVKEYRAGDVIFEEGEAVYFAGMVVSGILRMEVGDRALNINAQQMIPIPSDGNQWVRASGRVTAGTDCRVLFMKWIRLMKICNFKCEFHKQLLTNLESLMK